METIFFNLIINYLFDCNNDLYSPKNNDHEKRSTGEIKLASSGFYHIYTHVITCEVHLIISLICFLHNRWTVMM